MTVKLMICGRRRPACRASLPPFAEGATAMILAQELVLYPGAGRG